MAASLSFNETEIKLRAPNPAAAAELLTTHGFTISKARIYERNSVFDTPSGELRAGGRLLRLRDTPGDHTLTYKGGSEPGKHKIREEIETRVGDSAAFERILDRLGYLRTFIYEKYRTEFRDDSRAGVAMLDETLIGTFLELEGEATWIDETADRLGFRESDYITASYARLYFEWCAERGIAPGHMVWPDPAHSGERPPDH
jgi:adenylate cyclase class 2